MSRPEQRVSITSLFGMRTKKGLVRIKIGSFDQQWESDEARRVGYMLLEAAEAADGDQLIYRWATQRLGVDEARAAQILADFRIMRAEEPSVLAKTFSEILEEPDGNKS